MIRSFFLAIGIFVVILGLEFMVLDRAVIVSAGAPAADGVPVFQTRDIRPPEWVPWMLTSAGIVVVLYSFTIPKRSGG